MSICSETTHIFKILLSPTNGYEKTQLNHFFIGRYEKITKLWQIFKFLKKKVEDFATLKKNEFRRVELTKNIETLKIFSFSFIRFYDKDSHFISNGIQKTAFYDTLLGVVKRVFKPRGFTKSVDKKSS